MSLIKLSVNRPVLMTMVVMSFIVLGIFSFLELGVELFPQIEFPFVTVRTIYAGAGPVEIENLITKPIEEEVSAINGVKTITSTSVEGVSIVAIEFEIGVDVDIAGLDVKDKIEIVKPRLPLDAEDPSILKFDMGAESVMNLAVSGERPLDEIFEITEDVIKPELMKIQGLASIDIIGGKKREIKINLRREMMRSQDVSIMDVVMALATENLNIPSGRIKEKRKEYNIRVNGEFDSVDEIYDIIMSMDKGRNVRLRDVAYIVDDFEEQRRYARYNLQSSVGVSLVKRADANVVQVVDNVAANLDYIQSQLPEDMKIEVASDNSVFIRQSISEVVNNMGIGIILTGLILFLFLHTWQGTIIAAVSMPTSIIATFILIRFADFTLNFMTLLGLAVTIGVLVTNSIVVLENIIRYIKKGLEPKDASIKGTTEIAVAVGASTLTNVVVFTPIAFMGGIIGQFFYSFGLTVAFATIFSLFVSFTLTPMLASKMLVKKEGRTYGFELFALLIFAFLAGAVILGLSVFAGSMLVSVFGSAGLVVSILVGLVLAGLAGKTVFKASMEELQKSILYKTWYYLLKSAIYAIGLGLNFALFYYLFNAPVAVIANMGLALLVLLNIKFNLIKKYGDFWDQNYDRFAGDYQNSLKWALNHQGIILVVILIVFASSLSIARFVGSEFIPNSDQGYVNIAAELPPGSNIDQSNRTLQRIENILEEFPEIESFYTVIGQAPGTFIGISEGVQYGQITVKLVPQAERDIATSEMIEILKRQLVRVPMAEITLTERSTAGGDAAGALQLEITGDDIDELNDIAGQLIGIARTVPGATDIKISTKEGVPELTVLPDRKKMADYGISLATLASELRSNIDGNIATKYRVGNKEYDIRVQLDKSYLRFADTVRDITIRKDGNYIPITELATVTETEGPTSILRKNKQRLVTVSMNVVNRSLGEIVEDIQTRSDQLDLPSGYAINFGGQAEIQQESFGELLQTLILAIILSFLVLAAIMESTIHPFIIMMTLPLGLIGVIFSLVITGKTISIMSLMAMVMLVGIVVNNGILLIDYMQILRKEGASLKEAIVEASTVRLRPILMTNMATIISMVPLALELGEGSEMRSPMAIVSIGALMTSTLFTLYLIPIMYNIIESVKAKGGPPQP
ncbi:efflux RND transporter permease subunit [candidate division KSB1 bacterium]